MGDYVDPARQIGHDWYTILRGKPPASPKPAALAPTALHEGRWQISAELLAVAMRCLQEGPGTSAELAQRAVKLYGKDLRFSPGTVKQVIIVLAKAGQIQQQQSFNGNVGWGRTTVPLYYLLEHVDQVDDTYEQRCRELYALVQATPHIAFGTLIEQAKLTGSQVKHLLQDLRQQGKIVFDKVGWVATDAN